MSDPRRIDPNGAREIERSGTGVLVCAYDDDEKFARNRLEGAVSLSQLTAMKSRLEKDAKIIFY